MRTYVMICSQQLCRCIVCCLPFSQDFEFCLVCGMLMGWTQRQGSPTCPEQYSSISHTVLAKKYLVRYAEKGYGNQSYRLLAQVARSASRQCEANATDDKNNLKRRRRDPLVLFPSIPIFDSALHDHAGTPWGICSPFGTSLSLSIFEFLRQKHCVASISSQFSTVPGVTAKSVQFEYHKQVHTQKTPK